MKRLDSTAERFKRYLRDLEEYRRRSIWRRSQGPRYRRYLGVVPNVFLEAGKTRVAPLRALRESVVASLLGRAVWTLDTAARLRFGVGLLRTDDVQGYVADPSDLDTLVVRGLTGAPRTGDVSVDPAIPRSPLAIFSVGGEMPAAQRLGGGQLVVTDERLVEDIFGTLGFRPDLLARLEARGLARPGG